MPSVRTGNAGRDGAARSGWIVGHFLEEDPARRTRDVEIKWATHRPGETNGSFAANRTATTLSILIRGRFRLRFREDDQIRDVLLADEGDYALWPPNVLHDWVAEDECLIVTVRWPSVPRDQAAGG